MCCASCAFLLQRCPLCPMEENEKRPATPAAQAPNASGASQENESTFTEAQINDQMPATLPPPPSYGAVTAAVVDGAWLAANLGSARDGRHWRAVMHPTAGYTFEYVQSEKESSRTCNRPGSDESLLSEPAPLGNAERAALSYLQDPYYPIY